MHTLSSQVSLMFYYNYKAVSHNLYSGFSHVSVFNQEILNPSKIAFLAHVVSY